MLVKPVLIGEYGYMPFSFAAMMPVNNDEIYRDLRVFIAPDYSACNFFRNNATIFIRCNFFEFQCNFFRNATLRISKHNNKIQNIV